MTGENALAPLSRAVYLLAQSRTLDEVLKIRNMASAAEQYARAEKLGTEAAAYAMEIKVRAARKAGEILAASPLREGRPEKQSPQGTVLPEGVSKKQSSRWQRIADVPQEQFEEAVEAGASETSIARLAAPPKPPRPLTASVAQGFLRSAAGWLEKCDGSLLDMEGIGELERVQNEVERIVEQAADAARRENAS